MSREIVADRIGDVDVGCACSLWAHSAKCGLPVGLGPGVIEKGRRLLRMFSVVRILRRTRARLGVFLLRS